MQNRLPLSVGSLRVALLPRYPRTGDVAKAIGVGAATVMLGYLLAGTDESPGIVMTRHGRRMRVARGMASKEAAVSRTIMDFPATGMAEWEDLESKVAAEGVQAPVACRGQDLR